MILVKPNFAPGKNTINGFGIYVSSIYNIKLYPTISPKKNHLLYFHKILSPNFHII